MRRRLERLERLQTRNKREASDPGVWVAQLVEGWSSSYWSSHPTQVLRLVDVLRADMIDEADNGDSVHMPPSLLANVADEADFVRNECDRWAEAGSSVSVEKVRSEIDGRYELADSIREALSTYSASEKEALEASFADRYEQRVRDLGEAARGLRMVWN